MKEVSKRDIKILKDIFYAILVGLAIVFFWRGTWSLIDIYFFPNNLALSYSLSAMIGIIILYSTKRLIKHLL